MNLFKIILIVFAIAGFLAFILLFAILRALGKADSQRMGGMVMCAYLLPVNLP